MSRKGIVKQITNLTLKEKMVCIIWLLIAAVSMIFFNFSFDSSAMIISGNLLLDGHILDYYEEIERIIGSSGIYPILCPLFYAIWNIPVRILTGVSYVEFGLPFVLELWNKLLPILFYVLTGIELGRIIDELEINDDKYAKMVWFFMPISFFVVFVMGIYDIFYAFFAVVGLRFYFKDWSNRRNKLLFIFFFGIAICFKTFPLFFFLALLLAKEKKIRNIILDLIFFIIPYSICALPFIRSEAFINNCLKFSGNSSGMLLVTTIGNINVMLVLAVLLYGYTYFKIKADCVGFEKKIILVCNMMGVCLYGLSDFHFQWLVLFVPFLTLLFVLNRDTNFEAVYILQIILMIALLCIQLVYDNNTYEYFFESGLLGEHGLRIIKSGENCWTIRGLLHLGDNSIICKSIALAIMLVLIFYGMNRKKRKNKAISINKLTVMLIVPILVYESLAVARYLPMAPKYILTNSLSYLDMSSVLICDPGTVLTEDFYVGQSTNIEKVQFYTITWGREYAEDQLLHVVIKNKNTGEELYSAERRLNYFSDGNYYDLIPDEKVELNADTWYQIEFSTNTVGKQETMALMLTNNSNNNGKIYINGRESDQHISAKIWSRQ